MSGELCFTMKNENRDLTCEMFEGRNSVMDLRLVL